MSGAKKSAGIKRVWRITSDRPHGEIVDAVAPAPPPAAPAPEPPSEQMLPPDTSFRSSSWDLLNGVEVSDESDTIPDDLFDQLFKR